MTRRVEVDVVDFIAATNCYDDVIGRPTNAQAWAAVLRLAADLDAGRAVNRMARPVARLARQTRPCARTTRRADAAYERHQSDRHPTDRPTTPGNTGLEHEPQPNPAYRLTRPSPDPR